MLPGINCLGMKNCIWSHIVASESILGIMQGKKPSGGGKGYNWALDKWVELVYFEDAVS